MTNRVISIEDARIVIRNFSGKEGRFNPAGKRNFCVLLDADVADELEADGWNVRWFKPKDEGDTEKQAYLQVSVSFDVMPPKIVLINSTGKTTIDEESVSILDYADIENVDLIIRPYNWSVNDKQGVKAYLKSMWVTISEDPFERKYMEVKDDSSLPF